MDRLKQYLGQPKEEPVEIQTENFKQWHNWLKKQDLSYNSFAFLLSKLNLKYKSDSGSLMDYSFLNFSDKSVIPTEKCKKLLEKSASKYCWEDTVNKLLMSGGFGLFLYAADKNLLDGQSPEALGVIMSIFYFLFLALIDYKNHFSQSRIYRIAQSLSEHEFTPESVDQNHGLKAEISRIEQEIMVMMQNLNNS